MAIACFFFGLIFNNQVAALCCRLELDFLLKSFFFHLHLSNLNVVRESSVSIFTLSSAGDGTTSWTG